MVFLFSLPFFYMTFYFFHIHVLTWLVYILNSVQVSVTSATPVAEHHSNVDREENIFLEKHPGILWLSNLQKIVSHKLPLKWKCFTVLMGLLRGEKASFNKGDRKYKKNNNKVRKVNFTHDIENNILRMKEMMFMKHFVSLRSNKVSYCLKYKYIIFRLPLTEDHIKYKSYRCFPRVPYLLKHLMTGCGSCESTRKWLLSWWCGGAGLLLDRESNNL